MSYGKEEQEILNKIKLENEEKNNKTNYEETKKEILEYKNEIQNYCYTRCAMEKTKKKFMILTPCYGLCINTNLYLPLYRYNKYILNDYDKNTTY
jgi:hypothetical protein